MFNIYPAKRTHTESLTFTVSLKAMEDIRVRAELLRLLDQEDYDQFLLETLMGMRFMSIEEYLKQAEPRSIPALETFMRQKLEFIGLTNFNPKHTDNIVHVLMDPAEPDSVPNLVKQAQSASGDFQQILMNLVLRMNADQ